MAPLMMRRMVGGRGCGCGGIACFGVGFGRRSVHGRVGGFHFLHVAHHFLAATTHAGFRVGSNVVVRGGAAHGTHHATHVFHHPAHHRHVVHRHRLPFLLCLSGAHRSAHLFHHAAH